MERTRDTNRQTDRDKAVQSHGQGGVTEVGCKSVGKLKTEAKQKIAVNN